MLEVQYFVSMFSEMSVNTRLHVYGDQINTKHVYQK